MMAGEGKTDGPERTREQQSACFTDQKLSNDPRLDTRSCRSGPVY